MRMSVVSTCMNPGRLSNAIDAVRAERCRLILNRRFRFSEDVRGRCVKQGTVAGQNLEKIDYTLNVNGGAILEKDVVRSGRSFLGRLVHGGKIEDRVRMPVS